MSQHANRIIRSEIVENFQEIYGDEVHYALISRATDSPLERSIERSSRPFESISPTIYFRFIVVNVLQDEQAINKSDLPRCSRGIPQGRKELVCMWLT